jgi:hypothetical protein
LAAGQFLAADFHSLEFNATDTSLCPSPDRRDVDTSRDFLRDFVERDYVFSK